MYRSTPSSTSNSESHYGGYIIRRKPTGNIVINNNKIRDNRTPVLLKRSNITRPNSSLPGLGWRRALCFAVIQRRLASAGPDPEIVLRVLSDGRVEGGIQMWVNIPILRSR